jgi:transcriptional regulator with XRE-family HTH domain
MEKILQKIIDIRTNRGYSQELMASMLNISQATYYKIEKGITELTLKRLIQISTLLETPIEKIIGIDSDECNKKEVALDTDKQYEDHIKSLRDEIAFYRDTFHLVLNNKK